MIEEILDFLQDCPLLENGQIKVDFIGEKACSYMVSPLPCNPVIKRYTDGAAMKQYLFAFSSREYLDAYAAQNIENQEFYERFAKWLDDMTAAKILPRIKAGTPQSIEAVDRGYLIDDDVKTGMYQIQCKLIYYSNL